MDVLWHPEARTEHKRLPKNERKAIDTVVLRLIADGQSLSHPHCSAVKGSFVGIRELRPRAGNSPWRAFYRRIGNTFVLLAIGPEARVNPKGFEAAIRNAEHRLNEFEEE